MLLSMALQRVRHDLVTEQQQKGQWGLPRGHSVKEPTCQCRRLQRCCFAPWVGKIPWRRKWLTTPVFLPGRSHGRRSLVGYIVMGGKESDMTEHARSAHGQRASAHQQSFFLLQKTDNNSNKLIFLFFETFPFFMKLLQRNYFSTENSIIYIFSSQ